MRRRADEGAVAVEFALTATLLLALVLGIVAFGIQFGARIVAAQAASEGARAAATGLSAAERSTAAQAAATTVLDSYGGIAAQRSISVLPDGEPPTRIEVEVSIDLSGFGFARLAQLIPALPNQARARVSVRVGGF